MIGEEIRRLRHEKELTQEQLSLTSGVDRAYLSELENGQRSPSVDMLMRLCKAMGESAGMLVGKLEGLRLVATPNENAQLVEFVHDKAGNLVKIKDGMGREIVPGFSVSAAPASPPKSPKRKR